MKLSECKIGEVVKKINFLERIEGRVFVIDEKGNVLECDNIAHITGFGVCGFGHTIPKIKFALGIEVLCHNENLELYVD